MSPTKDYSKFVPVKPRKGKKWSRVLLFVLIFFLLIFILKNILSSKDKNISELVSPITKEIINTGAALFNPDKNSEELERIVQNELTNTQGDYAIAIKNLKTGERYYYSEHKIFEAASLYKLFVMATVFQKIQNGDLDKSDILSQKIEVLNEKFSISSESAELTEGDITLPVQSALSRMITISDNYSALLLTEKVRLSQVSLFLNQNSFTDSKVGTRGENPTTSAYDVALFFQKLYNGEFADESPTNGMLALLKHQALNNKIPKYLPENVDISHKTGELGRLSHDSGIVFTPKGDYVIVVLSQTNSPPVANEKIAKISKAVYEYFVK